MSRSARALAATVLRSIEADAEVLVRAGFSPVVLAGFAESGSLAARLALCRLRDTSPDPKRREDAALWLERLAPLSDPQSRS